MLVENNISNGYIPKISDESYPKGSDYLAIIWSIEEPTDGVSEAILLVPILDLDHRL
jgi:hypothetical protein